MPAPREVSTSSANMYCSISGTIPSEPVVSTKSGHLYDRAIIEKLLSANGNKCPETGESLAKDELLPIKTTGHVAPMPPEKSSVLGVLDYAKEEWNRLTIELYQVKTQLHKTRQELATALYRYDASVRVIADLERERDLARHELLEVRNGAHPQPNPVEPSTAEPVPSTVAEEESGSDEIGKQTKDDAQLPPGLVDLAKKKGTELQKARKARKPTGVPSVDVISMFSETGRVAVDGKDTAITSVTCNGETTYAGCSSGKLHCVKSLKVSKSVDAHSGGVTSVWTGGWDDKVISGGTDGCVRVWDGELGERSMFEGNSAVVGVEGHGIGIIFCCYEDGFAWRDRDTGATLAKRKLDGRIKCGSLHPDGMVFALGGSGIGMWDVTSMTQVAVLGEKACLDVTLTEKGYYMVSCDGSEVEVWDLRKRQVVGTVEMGGAAGLGVDKYGEYGCVAGKEGVGYFSAKKRAKRVALVETEADSWTGRRGVTWGEHCAIVGDGNGIVRWYESK